MAMNVMQQPGLFTLLHTMRMEQAVGAEKENARIQLAVSVFVESYMLTFIMIYYIYYHDDYLYYLNRICACMTQSGCCA